jgi:hypothetical protein
VVRVLSVELTPLASFERRYLVEHPQAFLQVYLLAVHEVMGVQNCPPLRVMGLYYWEAIQRALA